MNSVAHVVDFFLHDAIARNASDIHLSCMLQVLDVKYRIDGLLYPIQCYEQALMLPIISRIKILAQINITQKRIPQDGKIAFEHQGRIIDMRVSTFPGIYGEKVVIRILDRHAHALTLAQLGFLSPMLNQFTALINRAHGFFLVTGPTGSGKTTTLYAVLQALQSPEKNIVTLEDPVEYNLAGITQGQVHPTAGFTFEKGMRALLRQDPDIAMIGEIRDKQTAEIAIQAALTGHLVLSTLHTNDAPSTIIRLMDMGIESFLINACLTGVLAQRLARTICASCRIEYEPSEHEKELMHRYAIQSDMLFKGDGCDKCNFLGYKGRTGIFELLVMTDALRTLIIRHPMIEQIHQQARADGMKQLLHDGIQKVQMGIIGLTELIRVLI